MCLTNLLENHFPQIEAKLEQNSVFVWRLPVEFSQSRFGGRQTPSNACTLIAISLAELIHRNSIDISGNIRYLLKSFRGSHRLKNEFSKDGHLLKFCPLLLSNYIKAIVNGNRSHEVALNKRRRSSSSDSVDPYFTIPDALIAVNNPFREIDFCSIVGPIRTHLPSYLRCVIHHPYLELEEKIYIIMIAFQRSVLFVYERSFHTISLIDTHLHGHSHGGLVASCSMTDVRDFSKWVSLNVFQESLYYQEQDVFQAEFELSVLSFCGEVKSSDCISTKLRQWTLNNVTIFPELNSSSDSSCGESPEKGYSTSSQRNISLLTTGSKRSLEPLRPSTSSCDISEKRLRF